MWSSSAGNKKTSTTNTISSSTPKSSSSNTTTCLCPKTLLTRKSMDEIWKGINLSSLQQPTTAPAVFPPATVLSWNNTSPEFEGSDRVRSDPQSQENHANNNSSTANCGPDPSFLSSLNSPFDALSPSTDPFPSFCKKRGSEDDDGDGNCRHKRMIKNRESAARSRARKQAYANGLETEVTRLLEENAKLRRQVDRYRAAAAAQLPKKPTLSRTLTAPF